MVKRLILASPAGTQDGEDYDFDEEIARWKVAAVKLPPNFVLNMMKKSWGKQISWFSLLRAIGPFGSHRIIKRTIRRRMPNATKPDHEALGNYMPQVMMKSLSTENCIFV